MCALHLALLAIMGFPALNNIQPLHYVAAIIFGG